MIATVMAVLLDSFLLPTGEIQGQTLNTGNPTDVFGTNAPNMPNSLFPTAHSSNTFTVNQNVGGHVFGGIAANSGDNSTNNDVSIQGGTIGSTANVSSGNVFGGWSYSGNVADNSVLVENATVRGIVFGGWINGGNGNNATGNVVTIGPGATLRSNLYGAYSQGNGGLLSTNSVTIDGGSITGNDVIIAGAYSAIGANTVSNNSVTLSGGTISNARIYGGRGQSGSSITGNTVAITGGTISRGTVFGGQSINTAGLVDGNIIDISGGNVTASLYGGYSGGSGAVTNNQVHISDGSVIGDIYGGYSSGGSATNNTVTIGNMANLNGSNLFGGFVASGSGDAFTNNTLNKNNDTAIGNVQNFQFINFGYSGNANIGTLSTTPTGSTQSGVTLDTGSNEITFAGVITGTGSLTKKGTGILVLTNDSNNLQNKTVEIQDGTLQLGNGGTTGRIVTSGFVMSANTVLAYNHSDDVTETQTISGLGKVIQSGTGTLTLAGNNSYTDGTEIERGTVNIVNNFSYGHANNNANNSGYFTFTGGDVIGETKNITVSHFVPELTNTFRTQAGAGDQNYVDLRNVETIADVDIGGSNGGAFYVAGNTSMNVLADNLQLYNNMTVSGLNDLYVEAGGVFNLSVAGEVIFWSGIAGGGELNIQASGDNPAAMVNFWNDDGATFSMGSTTVQGIADHVLFFDLSRASGFDRVEFVNSGYFHLAGDSLSQPGTVIMMGGAIIDAATISVTDGVILNPDDWDISTLPQTRTPSTLTLKASSSINLSDFVLLYTANAGGVGQTQSGLVDDGQLIPMSNNSLLNIISNNVTMVDGLIGVSTLGGDYFTHGDYLIIRTSDGFSNINTVAGLNSELKLAMDGFAVDPNSGDGPRGGYSFTFGNDSAASGTGNNVWLTHTLSSLSMDWTGGGPLPKSGDWTSNPYFRSLQEDNSKHDTNFLPGDKVYISGADDFDVNLPGGLNPIIRVSGLVVGRNTSETDSNGNYTISGSGGITADADSAFGVYVNSGTSDELVSTGKLEKFGSGTLTFTNTGGNNFISGIDLHGGTVEFNLANQLGGGEIGFLGNTTLWALDDVTLENNIFIDDGVAGNLVADSGVLVIHTGNLTGSSSAVFNKTGGGTVRLADVTSGSGFAGNVLVSSGTLDVTGDYSQAAQFRVETGAILSGTGTIGDTIIMSGGTMNPGGLTRFTNDSTLPQKNPLTINGDLTFDGGSSFDVRIVPIYGGFSDQVVVQGGTVSIDPATTLNVGVDYWNDSQRFDLSSRFTIIDATATTGITGDGFILNTMGLLPRGVVMEQGWSSRDTFDLWFRFDPNNGFGSLGDTPNRTEIGTTIDWLIVNGDPGLYPLIDRLSDPDWTDDDVRKQLDQLHGDLTPNALFMALKEPWRHPFHRLTFDDSIPGVNRHERQLWGEFTARHEKIGDDHNAHASTINRYGVAVGADQWLTKDSVLGVTFQYANPYLRQETGRARMDDYEIGFYTMTRLAGKLEMKAYLGYSRQQYHFHRTVSLPATLSGRHDALLGQLSGTTSGSALAASIELTRPVRWLPGLRVLPVAAADFEQAWIRDYRESAGEAALLYDTASLERVMLRFGVGGEYNLHNRLALNTKLQYATQVNHQEYPALGVRFANGTQPHQPATEIWGSRIGRDYLNFGLGAGWKMNPEGDKLFHVNYDAKWYDRATIHAGEAGFTKKW
ncbi:MAG: autotransporter domain-containing protein [Planctomycetaceae bacterium]|nr:autotransporter domain-containing protein [Planctomycetaceae bacterium]